MLEGVAAASGAAMFYNLSIVLQKHEAERVDTSGLRILASLAQRPLWCLAIGIQVLGLALHSFSLTRAPIALVQPIIAAGVVFVVIFAFLVLGERPGRREIAGMILLVGGIVLLVKDLHGNAGIHTVSTEDLAIALVASQVMIALLLGGVRFRWVPSGGAAVMLAGAAGLGQGVSDAMNRLVGAWVAPGVGDWVPPAAMAAAALLLFVCFGIQGLAMAQHALRRYRANTVVPCFVAVELVVPIVIAQAVYGQDVSVVAPLQLAFASVGITVGLAILCTSRTVASATGAAPIQGTPES